jgi:hypothetical protein
MLQQRQVVEVIADYHQFYLWDRGMNPNAPEDYTDDDVQRRIKTGAHVVVIQPERSMDVHVEVEIHDTEPEHDSGQWDHVAEASLHLPTGHLEVEECTGGTVAEFRVNAGWYRVRSFHGGLDTINASGLEGNDYYRVILWPAPADECRVLKQWKLDRPG